MSDNTMKKRSFKFPHAFVVMVAIIIIVAILSYIVPAGEFIRTEDPKTGMTVVDPSTYHTIERHGASFFDIFKSIQLGFVNGASIIFLIYFACFAIHVIVKTGSMHAAIASLLDSVRGKEKVVIPIFMVIFSIAGSTYGEWDTVYGLIPVFVGVAISMGYDALVGLAISAMSVAIGFASATTNPFTIGIAQGIAELPLFSGLTYRWICYGVFVITSIVYVLYYASRIQKDPKKSLVYGGDFSKFQFEDAVSGQTFGWKEKLTIIMLFACIAIVVHGTMKSGWYLDEISAAFLALGILVAFLWKYTPNQIAEILIESTNEVLAAGFIVGFSRGILIMIQNSMILDTIVYAMYIPLKALPKWLAAEGMLIIQTLINFFIPSGSGQAAVTMPIMIPLADSLGISRQVCVLAFQFGDGFSNILWPTGAVFVISSLAGIPIETWYKFFGKLFAILFILQSALIFVAMAINY